MSTLQKINLGTPPTAVDGDTSRVANTKANANVDVLSSQAALTNAGAPITVAQALTSAAHIGKRVNIALTAAGVINMPAASTCQADQVTLLRNTGTTVATLAIATGSGDSCALSKLNPGESVLMDTDGVHTWSVLMRGRTNSDNETVNGNCTVGGNESVAGTLGVAGLATLTGGASFGAGGQATISSAGAYSGVGAAYSGNVTVGGTFGVTGAASFTVRPTFAGNTPYDSGNFNPANYMPKSGGAFSGAISVTGGISSTGSAVVAGVSSSAPITSDNYNIGSGGVLLIYSGSAGTISFRTGGTPKYFGFDAGGNGTALNGSWVNGSDVRLKRNIATISGALDKVTSLRGVFYEKKDDPGNLHVGVIAQEVQAVFPEVVHEIDEHGLLGVSYGNLVGPLIEAVKELTNRVRVLEGRAE